MMKPSRPGQLQSERCGVWFDTVDLKVKAKKKQRVRPISKQLNPLARHGGYSLGVALNFTQTKIQMPATKQSSITAFLSSSHRVVNQAQGEPAYTSSSTSTGRNTPSTNQTSSGAKHKREIGQELSEAHKVDVSCDMSQKTVVEMEVPSWPEEVTTPSVGTHRASEEEKEDQGTEELEGTRGVYQDSSQFEDPSLGERCGEDLWSTSSPQSSQHLTESEQAACSTPDSEDRDVRPPPDTPRMRHESAGSVTWDSLLFEVGFGLVAEERTSTQRTAASSPWASQDTVGQGNHPGSSSAAHPVKRAPLSPLPNAALCSHTRWMAACPQDGAVRGPLSDTEMMFTQDSEGFRVIAHRDHSVQSRSCLKDHANIAAARKSRGQSACVALDQENEVFFTQDSEGNLVIKH